MINKKRVLIIGNGFDIDLGLPTKYSDFLNSNYFPKAGNLCFGISYKYQCANWIDIESELVEFALTRKDVNDDTFLSNAKAEYMTLCRSLRDYLLNIDYNKLNEHSNAAKILICLSNDPNLKILSFNYTPLNKLSNNLTGKTLKYLHVHGSLEDDNIILGCNDNKNINKNFNYFIKVSNPKYRSSGVREALNDADEVIIFGLSLGLIDYHYFDDFFNTQSKSANENYKKKKIRIFTHNSSSLDDIIFNMRSMITGGIERFFDINDFAIYCTNGDTFTYEIEEFYKQLKEEISSVNSYIPGVAFR